MILKHLISELTSLSANGYDTTNVDSIEYSHGKVKFFCDESSISSMSEEIDELNEKLNDAERELSDAEDEIQRLKNEISDLENE